MAERITVDTTALLSAAGAVDGLASDVESVRRELCAALLAAERQLAGAASAGALQALTDAAADVHGDLATALGGLAEGLESVSETVREVDVLSAEAARAAW